MDVIKIGVHANPSMTHLHVHLISPDFNSPSLKTKHHYNSFTTPFFVDLDKFPLDSNDELWRVEVREAYVRGEMKCWICRAVLKNIPVVKTHMAQCWSEWLQKHDTIRNT